MMVANDWNHRIREFDRGKDIRSDTRMEFHFFKLRVRKLTRLVEDVLRNRQLSHVVEQSSGFDRFQ